MLKCAPSPGTQTTVQPVQSYTPDVASFKRKVNISSPEAEPESQATVVDPALSHSPSSITDGCKRSHSGFPESQSFRWTFNSSTSAQMPEKRPYLTRTAATHPLLRSTRFISKDNSSNPSWASNKTARRLFPSSQSMVEQFLKTLEASVCNQVNPSLQAVHHSTA